jgi:hypothetical protein
MSAGWKPGWWQATVTLVSNTDRIGNAVRAHLANVGSNFLVEDRDPMGTNIPIVLSVDGQEADYTVEYALTDGLSVKMLVLENSDTSVEPARVSAVFIDITGNDRLVPQQMIRRYVGYEPVTIRYTEE